MKTSNDDFVDREAPSHSELWIQESRNQLKYQNDIAAAFKKSVQWQIRLTLTIVTVAIGFMKMEEGFPFYKDGTGWYVNLWYFSVLALFFLTIFIYIKLLATRKITVINSYLEMRKRSDLALKDKNFGIMRIIQLLGESIMERTEIQASKKIWQKLSYLILLAIPALYIWSLFL